MIKEWTNEFNPFNSYKLHSQNYRWKRIDEAEKYGRKKELMPGPALVTIDPINVCDLKCTWCNAHSILTQNKRKIDEETLIKIAKFLPEFKGSWYWGVEAVCIAGGGEPLLNPATSKFIDTAYEYSQKVRHDEEKLEIGVVTNGLNINKHLNSLVNCTWVGVSVDSGTPETFKRLKGRDGFKKVIKNIESLTNYANQRVNPLVMPGQGPGVSYKYLLYPDNVSDVYEAAKIAKKIGCKNLHIRPFGTPWDQIGKKSSKEFSYGDIELFKEQILKARELEDETFRVFGVTHKFDGDFRKSNEFSQCYAIFQTGVFMPPTSNSGKFNFGLCCDRRGDSKLTLYDLKDCKEVESFWGGEKHWEMFDNIKPSACPRCTYQPHNKQFAGVLKKDNLTYKFI